MEELDERQKNIITKKPQASKKYFLKYGRQENITAYLFDYATLCINKTYKRNGCILPFPNKGDLGITKNYSGITPTAIAVEGYNALFLKRFWPGSKKFSENIKTAFGEIDHWLWLFVKSSKKYIKKSQDNTIVRRFLPDIWFHTQRKKLSKYS